MRTITKEITLYKFEELSNSAKERVREWLTPDSYDWWDGITEDLNIIGLELVEFDLDRRSMCRLGVKEDLHHTAKQILENHSKECDTYIAAEQYINNDFDAKEFLHELQECYRIMLEKEWEYLISDECIQETCEVNEYEFDENGEIQ